MPFLRVALAAIAFLLSAQAAFATTLIRLERAEYDLAEGSSAQILVLRTGDTTGTSSVMYSIERGSAFDSVESVAATSGTITFAAGETVQPIAITIRADLINVVAASFITLSSPSNASLTFPTAAAIRRIDDDPPARVSAAGSAADEGSTVDFVVTLPYPRPIQTTISWTVLYGGDFGTATADDFLDSSDKINIAPDETRHTIRVRTRQDAEIESDETFTLRLETWDRGLDLAGAMPRGVIVDDDGGQIRGPGQLDLGAEYGVQLHLRRTSAAAHTLRATSSNPDIVSVAPSIAVPPHTRDVTFSVRALSPGRATITIPLPAELGGQQAQWSAFVTVPGTASFEKTHIHVARGETVHVALAMQPAQAAPVLVALNASGSSVSVPASVMIPAGQSAAVPVTGLRDSGTSEVVATLPPLYGSATTLLRVTSKEGAPPLAVSRIAPNRGATAGGTTVTIDTAHAAGPCSVTFGGVPATGVEVRTADRVTAITPLHPAGTTDAILECGGRRAVLAQAFTFEPAQPTLSSVSPASGNIAGGTVLRVSGANLLPSCGVTVGGQLATGVRAESDSALVAIAPPHAAGQANVGVACSTGFAQLEQAYAYGDAAEPAGAVTSLAPLTAAPGEHLTIRGSRLRPTDRITIGEFVATRISTVPDAHVVIVPELAPGRASVTITDANGNVSTTGPILEIAAAPAPAIAAAAVHGSELHVSGSGFRPALTFLHGTGAFEVVALEPRSAVLRFPRGAAGLAQLRVLQGSSTVATGPFVARSAALTLDAVSPRCAAVDGGATIRLHGSGFDATTRAAFDGTQATSIRVIDGGTLDVVVPPSLRAAAVTIHVTSGSGEVATLSGAFRYSSRFQPDSGCSSRQRTARH